VVELDLKLLDSPPAHKFNAQHHENAQVIVLFVEGIWKMYPPVVAPYLVGVVTAPLVVRIITPIVRGTVKATVGIALEAKKAAAEAGAELQGIAAEAGAAKGV
jgi:Protein of unknown function (DUF5132)